MNEITTTGVNFESDGVASVDGGYSSTYITAKTDEGELISNVLPGINRISVVVYIQEYSVNSIIDTVVCHKYVSPISGISHPSSIDKFENGEYKKTFYEPTVQIENHTYFTGCYKWRKLKLTVYDYGRDTIDWPACDSLRWNPKNSVTGKDKYQDSKVYYYHDMGGADDDSLRITDTLSKGSYNLGTDNNHCDSIVLANLWIWKTDTAVSQAKYTCDTFRWDLMDEILRGGEAVPAVNKVVFNKMWQSDTDFDTIYRAEKAKKRNYQNKKNETVQHQCDQVYKLNLKVYTKRSSTATENLCDTFTWRVNGYSHKRDDYTTNTWSAPKTYSSGLQKGDTNQPKKTITLNSSGLYTVHGCDSTVKLNLTIRNSSTAVHIDSACIEGSPYVIPEYGRYRTASHFTDTVRFPNAPYKYEYALKGDRNKYTPYEGDTVHINNYQMCDSVITLHLAVGRNDTMPENTVACKTYKWNPTYSSKQYKYDTITTPTPNTVYYDTVPKHFEINSMVGGFHCNHINQLTLTIYNDSTRVLEPDSSCGSYTWTANHRKAHGHRDTSYIVESVYGRTIDTILYDTVKGDVHGQCDSIFVKPIKARSGFVVPKGEPGYDIVDTCGSYKWHRNGKSYAIGEKNRDTVYFSYEDSQHKVDTTKPEQQGKNLSPYHQCDSVYVLELHTSDTIFVLDTAVCDTFQWMGTIYGNGLDASLTGTDVKYTVSREPSRVNGPFNKVGKLSHAPNCDSILILNLTVLPSYTDAMAPAEHGAIDSFPVKVAGYDVVCDEYQGWTRHGVDGTATSITFNYQDFVDGEYDARHLDDSLKTTASQALFNAGKLKAACDSVTHLRLSTDAVPDPIHIGEFLSATFCKTSVSALKDIEVCEIFKFTNSPKGNHRYSSKTGKPGSYSPLPEGKDSLVFSDMNDKGYLYIVDSMFAFNSYGCDSVDSLRVRVKDIGRRYERKVGCDSVYVQNRWLKHSDTIPTGRRTGTGVTGYAQNGCDSVEFISVKVFKTKYVVDSITACDSIRWGNINGNHYKTLYTNNVAVGEVYDSLKYYPTPDTICDSIVALKLTIYKRTSKDTIWDNPKDIYSCYNVTWRDSVYTANGESRLDKVVYKTESHTFAERCDKTYKVNLHIFGTVKSTSDTMVCTRFWVHPDHNTADTSGRIKFVDKDTNVVARLYQNVAMAYKNPKGEVLHCDSLVTYHVSLRTASNRVVDTGVCDTFVLDGVKDFRVKTAGGSWEPAEIAGVHLNTDNKTLTIGRKQIGSFVSMDPMMVHYIDSYNCEKRDTFVIKVYPIAYDTLVQSECDSFNWYRDRKLYTKTGYYNHITDDNVGYDMNGVEQEITEANINSLQLCPRNSVLNLTIKDSVVAVHDTNVCDSIWWYQGNGVIDAMTWFKQETTATYRIHREFADGCDSVTVMRMHFRYTKRGEDVYSPAGPKRACDQLSWHGSIYTEDTKDVYNDTIHREFANGCDSVVWLNLTLGHHSYVRDTDSTCSQSYVWRYKGGVIDTINHTGFYSDTLRVRLHRDVRNADGCDSIVSLKFYNYDNTVRDTLVDTACYEYVWHDVTYRSSTADWVKPYPQHIYKDRHGCDSTVSLKLTIYDYGRSAKNVVVCDSFELDGRWLKSSGDIIDTVHGVSQYGSVACDSIYALHLTVNKSSEVTDTVMSNVCIDSVWHGKTYEYSPAGQVELYDTLHNVANCDSVIRLTVSFLDRISSDTQVYACDTFIFDRRADRIDTFATPGVHMHADSVLLKSKAGCDSMVYVNLTLNLHRSDTVVNPVRDCDTVEYDGKKYYSDTLILEKTVDDLIGDHEVNTCQLWRYVKLKVDSSIHRVDSVVGINGSYHWSYIDSTITHDTVITRRGLPTPAPAHCDSTYTLRLKVDSIEYRDVELQGCIYKRATVKDLKGSLLRDTLCLLRDTFNRAPDTNVYRFVDTLGKTPLGSWIIQNTTVKLLGYAINTVSVKGCEEASYKSRRYTESIDMVSDLDDLSKSVITNEGLRCDSLLHLIVRVDTHHAPEVMYDTVCSLYTWKRKPDINIYGDTISRDTILSSAGTYVDFYNDGCNNRDTLHLYTENTLLDTSACNKFNWVENGVNYQIGDRKSMTVPYEISASRLISKTRYGVQCRDSLHLLLFEDSAYAWHVDEVQCDSFAWHLWTATGDFDTVFKENATYWRVDSEGTVNGCRRSDTLYFTGLQTTPMRDSLDSICNYMGPYMFYSHAVSWKPMTSGQTDTILDTIRRSSPIGCDSIVTLRLVVHTGDTSVYVDYDSIYCGKFTWDRNGRTYNFVDSLEYKDLIDTLMGYNVHGCVTRDSLHIKLRYSKHIGLDTTVCDRFEWTRSDGSKAVLTSSVTDSVYRYQTAGSRCYATDTLNLTVNYSSGSLLYDTCCYNAEGKTFNALGTNKGNIIFNARAASPSGRWDYYTYRDTIRGEKGNAVKCDSLVVMALTVVRGGDTAIMDTSACDGFKWEYNNNPDEWLDHDTNMMSQLHDNGILKQGCTSYDSLVLRVHTATVGYDTVEANYQIVWDNPLFTKNNKRYTDSTTIVDTLRNQYGCDSINNVALFVNQDQYDTIRVHACESFVWSLSGKSYTKSGKYDYLGFTATGCNLHKCLLLTVDKNTQSDSTHAPVCDSLHFYAEGFESTVSDTTVYQSGVYKLMLKNAHQCDSTILLTVTINRSSALSYDTASSCKSYNWIGTTYTESGDYLDTLTNRSGCDSVVTMHLDIVHPKYDTNRMGDQCAPFAWRGITLSQAINSADTVCDTSEHAVSGICDSVYMLTINLHEAPHAYYDTCDTAANGFHFTWPGTEKRDVFFEGGEWHYTHRDASNTCEGTDTLNLTLNDGDMVDTLICAKITFNWVSGSWVGEKNYLYNPTDTVRDTVWYVDTASKCNKRDLLVLKWADDTIVANEGIAGCDSLRWGGVLYKYSQTVSHTFKRTNGCDSTMKDFRINVLTYRPNVYNKVSCTKFYWEHSGKSYYESGTYTWPAQDATGCSGYDTLRLTINSATSKHEYETACDSFVWNHNSGRMKRYQHGASTKPGYYGTTANGDRTDTIRYTNEGGCVSVDYLHLHLNLSSHQTYVDSICSGRLPYVWSRQKNTPYSTTETYLHEYENANGCASTDTLHLTVNTESYVEQDTIACDTFVWHHAERIDTLFHSGEVAYSFANEHGCPSDSVLNVTISPSYRILDSLANCGKYWWEEVNGREYTSSCRDSVSGTTIDGCDSVHILDITINNYNDTAYFDTVCDNEGFHWFVDGWDTVIYNTGDYEHIWSEETGCGKRETLHLFAYTHFERHDTVSACDRYIWDLQPETTFVFSQDVQKTYSFTDRNGCKGIATLDLKIHPNYYEARQADTTVCDQFTWRGRTYTTSCTLNELDTLTSTFGCDSVVQMNKVTIITQPKSYEQVTQCNSYMGNQFEYGYGYKLITHTESSIDTFKAGPNVNGCDSIHILVVTINHDDTITKDTTVCDTLYYRGIRSFVTDTTGVFLLSGRNDQNCQSYLKLNLHVNHSKVIQERDIITCEEAVWRGNRYTLTDSYRWDTVGANGCDSTRTVNIIISQNDTVDKGTVTQCDSYYWRLADSTYTESTRAYYVDPVNLTSGGCKIVNTLLVNINYSDTTEFDTLACHGYRRNGVPYLRDTRIVENDYEHMTSLGCDSVVIINLKVRSDSYATLDTADCVKVKWNRKTYYTNTIHYDTLPNVAGCDSIVTVNITVYSQEEQADTVLRCDVPSYTWPANGCVYRQSTVDSAIVVDAHNCLIQKKLHLKMEHYHRSAPMPVKACESYRDLNSGAVYTQSATIMDTIAIHDVCDSIAIFNLTINLPVYDTTPLESCHSYDWEYSDTAITQSGDYVHPYWDSNVSSCISYKVLRLTINGFETDDSVNGCQSVVYRGRVYIASSEFDTNYPIQGSCCDTLVHVHINVDQDSSHYDTIKACDAYVWQVNGQRYTGSTTYCVVDTMPSGCVNANCLFLTVNNSSYVRVDTVVMEDTLIWNNKRYTTSGRVLDTLVNRAQCDSIVDATITFSGMPRPYLVTDASNRVLMINHYPNGEDGEAVYYFAYQWFHNDEELYGQTNDKFQNADWSELNGCYYVKVAVDPQRTRWIKSDEICFSNSAIEGVDGAKLFAVYPNPATVGTPVTIQMEGYEQSLRGSVISILDLYGREVLKQAVTGSQMQLMPKLSAGVYMVQLITADGQQASKRLVIGR
ncbi:MAG: T9SS type A sorting domain-containing protein [Bacteroidales bacterium]|nr:T9SS type A sorting domain-containing protein [Candidatus Colimorpha onthohippi]